MRFLRFAAALGAVLLGYLALLLFAAQDPTAVVATPSTPLPDVPGLDFVVQWMRDALQPLLLSARQVPQLAPLWLLAAMLLFGAAIVPWSHSPPPLAEGFRISGTPGATIILWGCGLGIALFQIVWPLTGRPEVPGSGWLWALSILAYLGAALIIRRPRARTRSGEPGDPAPAPAIHPERGWRVLIPLLLLAGGLLLWHLEDLPAAITPESAAHGAQSLALLTGRETRLFAFGWADTPLLAYVPAALGMGFSRDLVTGMRLAGVAGGLLALVATWLLGCEIFRRPPTTGHLAGRRPSSDLPTLREDDGHTPALLAVTIAMGSYFFFSLGRVPREIEPIGWGTLGLWALLRGLRTGDNLTLALSGLTLGLAALMEPAARFFIPLAALWVGGVQMEQSGFRKGGLMVAGAYPLLVWAGGILLTLAPAIGQWIGNGDRWWAPFASLFPPGGIPGQRVAETVLWLLVPLNDGQFPDAGGPLLHGLLAPFAFLAVAAMLLYPGRRPHWTLLSWLVVFLWVSGATPGWTGSLALLPAVALAVALAMDRLRITGLTGGGQWLEQLSLFLMAGIVLLAGLYGWIGFVAGDAQRTDVGSDVARALGAVSAQETIVLLTRTEGVTQQPQVHLVLSAMDRDPSDLLVRSTVSDDVPPTRGVVFLATIDSLDLLATVRQQSPGGELTVFRDRLAQPRLYLYRPPGE